MRLKRQGVASWLRQGRIEGLNIDYIADGAGDPVSKPNVQCDKGVVHYSIYFAS